MPRVFGSKARNVTLRGARQIVRLQGKLAPLFDGDEADLSAACRYRIFFAGASNHEMPACAHTEFRKLYED
jgi:hypothetical protein